MAVGPRTECRAVRGDGRSGGGWLPHWDGCGTGLGRMAVCVSSRPHTPGSKHADAVPGDQPHADVGLLGQFQGHTVLIRVLQRNRTDRMYTYMETYAKELAHAVLEAETPGSPVSKLETQENPCDELKSKSRRTQDPRRASISI